MTNGKSIKSDLISSKSLQAALKLLASHDPEKYIKLGNHPIARLNSVQQRLPPGASAGDPKTIGKILHAVLVDAVRALNPKEEEGQECEREENLSYYILYYQYVKGRGRDVVGQDCKLWDPGQRSWRAYESARKLAITELASKLEEWERESLHLPTVANLPRLMLVPPKIGPELRGREELLQEAKNKLKEYGTVALLGSPGTGKTRLALELAYDEDLAAYFYHGTLWASLGIIPNPSRELAVWGEKLGIAAEISQKASLTEKAKAVHEASSDRYFLFIIDDAWKAKEDLSIASYFQVGSNTSARLLTTRFAGIAQSFAYQGVIEVPELEINDGMRLFKDMTGQMSIESDDDIKRLVEVVGGNPLAIIIMASYAKKRKISLFQVTQAFKEAKEEVLKASIPQNPLLPHPSLPDETPLSLWASIGLSDDGLAELISETARYCLWSLAVFPSKPSSFTLEAAAQVFSGAPEILPDLVDASLVEFWPGESPADQRYSLHPTITAYATARLNQSPQLLRSAQTNFINYYVALVKRQKWNFGVIEPEQTNIEEALGLAEEQGVDTEFLSGVSDYSEFLYARGHHQTAEMLLTKARQMATLQGDEIAQFNTLQDLGRIARRRGEYDQAEKLYREAYDLAQKTNDDGLLSLGARGLGMARGGLRDFAQEELLYRESLRYGRLANDPTLIAMTLGSLGGLLVDFDRYDEAKQHLREARTLILENGLLNIINPINTNLGAVLAIQVKFEEEEKLYLEALVVAEASLHYENMAALYTNLASLTIDRGMYGRSSDYIRKGLAAAVEVGDIYRLGSLLRYQGEQETDLGNYPQAEASLQKAFEQAQRVKSSLLTCSILANFGRLMYHLGRFAQAENYLDDSLSLAQISNYDWHVSDGWIKKGELFLRMNDLDQAWAAFGTGFAVAQGITEQKLANLARFGKARVAAAKGDLDTACRDGHESFRNLEEMKHKKAAIVKAWLSTLPCP